MESWIPIGKSVILKIDNILYFLYLIINCVTSLFYFTLNVYSFRGFVFVELWYGCIKLRIVFMKKEPEIRIDSSMFSMFKYETSLF